MKLCLVCNLHFTDEQETCPKDNAPLVPISKDPLIGVVIQERYKIEELIGKGSMGVVYRATQELIGRPVAVKVLHSHLVSDKESLKRFHQQARAASRLNHPHIITLYDYGVIQGGQPFIVMDLLTGKSLAQVLEERTNLPLEECLPVFQQICEALGDAHKHGVVHRDVKPDNIVLENTTTQKADVKVVDFGIAKLVQGSEETLTRITRTGTVCGSPTYMSPEQFQGSDVDQRSDIYSLGTVLFETLTGRLPFTARDLVGLMALHVAEPPPRLRQMRPDLAFPAALEKVLERALAKEPADRQQSMEDFWDELYHAATDQRREGRSRTEREEISAAVARDVAPVSDDEIKSVIASHVGQMGQRPQAEAEVTRPDHRAVSPAQAQSSTQRLSKSRAGIPFWVRIVGFLQGLIPFALTLFLFSALLWVLSSDERLSGLFDEKVQPVIKQLTGLATSLPAREDVEELFHQGKMTRVVAVLEEKGSLTAAEKGLLHRAYLGIGEHEGKAGHYQQAVRALEKIPAGSLQYAKARTLLKRYRRLAPK